MTRRLLLRAPREDDLDAWAALHADFEVMRWLGPRPCARPRRGLAGAVLPARPLGAARLRAVGARASCDTGELVGRAGPLPAGGLARARGGLDARPPAVGQGIRHRGRPCVARLGLRPARRRPRDQPDRPRQRPLAPGGRAPRARPTRAGPASAGTSCTSTASTGPATPSARRARGSAGVRPGPRCTSLRTDRRSRSAPGRARSSTTVSRGRTPGRRPPPGSPAGRAG